MVDVVDGAGVDMDGAGQGVGESSMSANEHKEWQLQDPAERPETPPLEIGASASRRGSPRAAEEDAAMDSDDGEIEEESRDAFHFPAGFAAGFLADLEDVDEAEGNLGVEEEVEEQGEAGAARAEGEEGLNSGTVLQLSDESASSKVKITRWLRKASLLMPEAGPMLLDSTDATGGDDEFDGSGSGHGPGPGHGEIRPVGSRTVSNKSILSQRTMSQKTISQRTISHRTLSQKTISRGSLMSARTFTSSKSVAASIISAVGGSRAPRPVMNSTAAGASASEKVIEEYVMSQAAKEIDEKTLVTRKSEYGRFLTSRFLRATRLPAGMLDKMRDRTQNLLSQSRPALPSTCLLALLSKRWFIFCLVCQVALCLYRGVNGVSATLNHFSLNSIQEFRLISAGLDPIQPLSLSLLFDGCPIKIGSTTIDFYDESLGGQGLKLTFNETVAVNGWCVQFAAAEDDDEEEKNRHAYRIQGRTATGEWATVGASRWTLVESVVSEMPDAPPRDGPCISIRPSWMWDAAIYVVPIVEGSLLIAAIISARLRHEVRGMYFVAGALSGPIPVEIVIAALCIAFQEQDVGLLTFLLSKLIVRVITTAAVWWRKQILLEVLALGGLVLFLADVILQASGFGIGNTIVPRLVWLDAALCVMPIIYHFMWSVSETVRVGLEMADIFDSYEEIWAKIQSEQMMDLETLQGLTTSHDGFGQARQLNRLRIGAGQTSNPGMESTGELSNMTGGPPGMGGSARGSLEQGSFSSIVLKKQSGGSLPGVLDAESPVESLDQLFAQAAGCDNFVRSKVKKWAKESGGMLMVDDELMTWTDIEEKGVQSKIQWARCKKPERAIGKAFFGYGGKVSNLVDLCRQRIVFEDVASLGLCVVRMLKDTETRVERVKNFMGPDFDACPRGGLRQVVVNLRLDDPFTRWLGIESHVCEVCLLLRPFAQRISKLTEAQHKSYILMRNSRPSQVSLVPIQTIQRIIRGTRVAPLPFKRTPSATTERSGKLADDIKSLALRDEVERMSKSKRNRAPSWQKRWSFVGHNAGGHRPSLQTASIAANSPNSHQAAMRHLGAKPNASVIPSAGSWKKSEARVREEYLWQEFFISSYLNTTMDVGAFLERRLQREVAAMKMASAASALYMSRPIAAAATTTWFRFCLALISLTFAFDLVANMLIYSDLYEHKARCVRFSSIGAAGGNNNSPWVEGGGSLVAGLMVGGCKYGRQGMFPAQGFDYSLLDDAVEKFSHADGGELTICFDKVATFDGWYIDDNATRSSAFGSFRLEILGRKRWADMDLHHVLQDDFEIESAADLPADGWNVAGTSGAVFGSNARWIMKDTAGRGPWMLYTPWNWTVSTLITDGFLITVPLLCLYLAHLSIYRYVHLCISAMFAAMSVANLAAGLGYLVSNNSYSAYAPLSASVVYSISVAMVFYEFRIVLLILILGLWTFGTSLIEVYVVMNTDSMSRMPTGAFILTFAWVIVVFRRYRALVYAQKLVENDVTTYSEAWEKVLEGEDVNFWIEAISAIQHSVRDKATWHRYVLSKYEQPDLRQCNRKDTNDDTETYDSGEKKAEEWVFRNLAKEQIQAEDTSALANLCLATEVSTIEDMEPPSKHGHEAKQADTPKLQGNGEALYSNSGRRLVPSLLRKESSGMSRNSMSESSMHSNSGRQLVPSLLRKESSGMSRNSMSESSMHSNSGRQLVPSLLRKESSGMSRNSMSESSQPPVMSPTISTGVKLGSESGSGKWMLSPSGSVPALEDTTRASAPAVPEFKRTGTAEFDVNATIMRVGSKGLERFDSQGGIQRMAEDEALPGIVMVHNPIEASQMPIVRRTQPLLDQVLEDKSGEDVLRGSTTTLASGTSFGGDWEDVCTPPGDFARSGAELRVCGQSFGQGIEHLQNQTQAAPLTDEARQSAVADVANSDASEAPEAAVSSPDRLPPHRPTQLMTKAHERLVGEDAAAGVPSPLGADSPSIKNSPRRYFGGSRRGSIRSVGSGGADMPPIDGESPKNSMHGGVSMADILFGHGRTRKPSQAHTGRLQTLPQNGQLEWKGGESPSAMGLVKKAASHSSIGRLLRTGSGGSLASKRSKNDSIESRKFFTNSSRSGDAGGLTRTSSQGDGEGLTRTSSQHRTRSFASIDRENVVHAAADGAMARRLRGDSIQMRSFDAQGNTPTGSRENIPSADFASLSKQQQGTRLRQAISAQPAAAGLGGHDDDGNQNALQRQIDKAKSIDDLGTMISAMDPLEANNEVLKGKEGSVDWASPIRSLDQLFAQAAGLDIILKAMVQRWAFSSDGSFSLKGNKAFQKVGFVKWREASKNPAKARWIKWGKIKTPERAIEKAFRSYKGDVSKLLDLTRQTIVYDDISSLYEGLKAICDDPDVVVERVKNRMEPGYDARLNSAGYRDVSLNIRIVNETTMGMGIETHVCEVQLLLKAFAMLKNDDGHARYVTWRNTRGE